MELIERICADGNMENTNIREADRGVGYNGGDTEEQSIGNPKGKCRLLPLTITSY